MTIGEIKNLTKFLNDDDVEKIKEEIKSKETILKSDNMDEEEMTQVLNTLFAIMVIEKALESEIDGIEEIRAELEAELMESYQIYDAHMLKYKKEEKKKKKSWLINFLFLSDRIGAQKKGIGASDKTIENLKKELNQLKQQSSNENLKEVARGRKGNRFEDFCKTPHDCHNIFHDHDKSLEDRRDFKRIEKLDRAVREGRKTENLPRVHNHREKPILTVKTDGVVPEINEINIGYNEGERGSIDKNNEKEQKNSRSM